MCSIIVSSGKKMLRIWLYTAIILSNTHLSAESNTSDNNETEELTTINVVGEEEYSEKDLNTLKSNSSSHLTIEDISRNRGLSVGDIFSGETGVLVGENRNSGGLDVNIRGMQGQGRVPVLIDGSRQESTVYRGYSGVASRSYIDPDLMGSISITKGPVISSVGATGGVVEANTLDFNDIVKDDKDYGFRLRVTGIGNNSSVPNPGTYAGYYLPRSEYNIDCVEPAKHECSPDKTLPKRFAPKDGMNRPSLFDFGGYSVSFSGAKQFDLTKFNLGTLDLVAAYSTREQGNYHAGNYGKTPKVILSKPRRSFWRKIIDAKLESISPFRGNERIPNTGFANQSLLLKTHLKPSLEHSFKLSYLRFNGQHGEMMPSQIKLFGQAKQWLDSTVVNNMYTATYKWQPLDFDWADLKLKYWQTDTLSTINTPSVGSNDLKDNSIRLDDYQRKAIEIENTSSFYGLGKLDISYGASLQIEEKDSTSTDTGFYAGSRQGKRHEESYFASAKLDLNQFLLMYGLRYTKFNVEDKNNLELSIKDPACVPNPDPNKSCLPIKYKNDLDGFAPIFYMQFEPINNLQLYYRQATSIRMPSMFESTSGFSVSPSLDIDLKPEKTTNKEFGINYVKRSLITKSDKLRFKAVYFDNKTIDYLTRTQPDARESPKPDLFKNFFRLRNIDSLHLKGTEINLTYDLNVWFINIGATKYDFIEVCNVGSYLHVRYFCTNWGITQSFSNNMIPPNYSGKVHTGVRLLDKKLEISLRSTFIGDRNKIPKYNAKPGFNKPVTWDAYQLFSLYANYNINPKTTIDLTIDNLTDSYYLDALSLASIPSPGRTLQLGFTTYF